MVIQPQPHMIKFFRHIRKQLLAKSKFSKYLLYAIGEIVLVVIGILIALQINNWNENRKEQKKTSAYLAMLSDEIKTNLKRLDRSTEMAKAHREYNLNTLKELNSESAKTIDLDEFYAITTSQGPFSRLELVRSSFDDLINSGAMENVKDSLLRNQIFGVEPSYKQLENEYTAVRLVWEQQIRPYHLEHLNETRIITRDNNWNLILKSTDNESLKFDFETDMEAFIYNRKYANILTGNIIYISNYEGTIVDIRKRFATTLANIELYLNKEIL